MSRPAFRPSHRRTTDCPTCEAPRLHPCVRVRATGEALLDALDDHGETVSPHAARLRAEAALREDQTRSAALKALVGAGLAVDWTPPPATHAMGHDPWEAVCGAAAVPAGLLVSPVVADVTCQSCRAVLHVDDAPIHAVVDEDEDEEDPGEDCLVCSGPYCRPGTCSGQPGYVWVDGMGWTDPEVAQQAARRGRTVHWDDRWTVERFGEPPSRSVEPVATVGPAEVFDYLHQPPEVPR